MPPRLKYGTVSITLIGLSYLPTAQNASAISAEVAKKCGALTDTAYRFARLAILLKAVRQLRDAPPRSVLGPTTSAFTL